MVKASAKMLSRPATTMQVRPRPCQYLGLPEKSVGRSWLAQVRDTPLEVVENPGPEFQLDTALPVDSRKEKVQVCYRRPFVALASTRKQRHAALCVVLCLLCGHTVVGTRIRQI